jgi:hypothetical protein
LRKEPPETEKQITPCSKDSLVSRAIFEKATAIFKKGQQLWSSITMPMKETGVRKTVIRGSSEELSTLVVGEIGWGVD